MAVPRGRAAPSSISADIMSFCSDELCFITRCEVRVPAGSVRTWGEGQRRQDASRRCWVLRDSVVRCPEVHQRLPSGLIGKAVCTARSGPGRLVS